jgi:hypothetical protein
MICGTAAISRHLLDEVHSRQGVSVVPPLVALSERERGTRQAARVVQPGPRVVNWMAAVGRRAGVLNPLVVLAGGSASGHCGALRD